MIFGCARRVLHRSLVLGCTNTIAPHAAQPRSVCAPNTMIPTSEHSQDIYTWITHGKGILGSQGDYNAKHRRLCAPPFRNNTLLKRFSSVITERASTISDALAQAAVEHQREGSQLCVDVSLHTQRLTLDVVGMTAFSHDFQQVEQTRKDFAEVGTTKESVQDKLLWAVNTFGEVLASVFITPLPLLKVLDKLGFQELKKLTQAVDIMRDSMLDVIAVRRVALCVVLCAGTVGQAAPTPSAADRSQECRNGGRCSGRGSRALMTCWARC
jgi:hypothetical protein